MNKFRKYHSLLIMLVLSSGVMFLTQSCRTGIEDSPNPGILRVILQPDDSDNSLLIGADTVVVKQYYDYLVSVDSTINISIVSAGDTSIVHVDSITTLSLLDNDIFIVDQQSLVVTNDTLIASGNILDMTMVLTFEDTVIIADSAYTVTLYKNSTHNVFNASVFQGKIYHDSFYAILFTGVSEYVTIDRDYNLLEQEKGHYKSYIIFESYVPPGKYNMLEFGLTASELILGDYYLPIMLPEGEGRLITIYDDFEVVEDEETEINLKIRPLESLSRYRDTFIFNRAMEVIK